MDLLSNLLLQVALLLPAAQMGAVIKGQISDPEGAVIAKATIRVLDEATRQTVQTAHTDADGRFAITESTPGRYTLAVASTGFQEKLIDLGEVAPGSTIERRITLETLDCDAPEMICDNAEFTAGSYIDPHPIVLQRNLTVGSSDSVDLDKGLIVTDGSASADFEFAVRNGGLYLIPANHAKIAVPGSGAGCRKPRAQIAFVRIDGRGPNSEFRLITKHGNCAKIYPAQSISPGAAQADLDILTRQ
jgi:hypothetical protein